MARTGSKRKKARQERPTPENARKVEKVNPFDLRVTRQKHAVPGQRTKGLEGRPGLKRQAGDELRKKSLLQEYGNRRRQGGIVDKRFGQGDLSISPEAKMLERFTRAQHSKQIVELGNGSRLSKRKGFNLEDSDVEEGGDGQLTHLGQSLGEMDPTTLAGPRPQVFEDAEDAFMDPSDHFGGGVFERSKEDDQLFQVHPSRRASSPEFDLIDQRKKSKAEVMAELIAKSKGYKYERQKAREEDEDDRIELDKEFDELKDILFDRNEELHDQDSIGVANLSSGKGAAAPPQTDDDYDETYRQLTLDRRARPTDRLKTEEELAKEEAEALEEAEKARLARMTGDAYARKPQSRREKKRAAEADDLEDDFQEDEQEDMSLGRGLVEALEADESDLEADEDNSDLDSQSFRFESNDESTDDQIVDGELQISVEKRMPMKDEQMPSAGESRIPYTFACPATHSAFLTLVTASLSEGKVISEMDNRTLDTIIHRIRILHHPSRHAENHGKLRTLLNVLLDHFIWICHEADRASTMAQSITHLDIVTRHILEMSAKYTTKSAQLFVAKILLMNKNLDQGLSNEKAGKSKARTWPGMTELLFLKLVGNVWPTSDLNHPVILPASLLLGRYLGECRVRRLQDIAAGLFACSLFNDYQILSKRLVPEAINFLGVVFAILSPAVSHRQMAQPPLEWTFPVGSNTADLRITTAPSSASAVTICSVSKIHDDIAFKDAALDLTCRLTQDYAGLYASCEAFPELFSSLQSLLQGLHDLPNASLSGLTKMTSHDTLKIVDRIRKLHLSSRPPLQLHQHRPIPLSTHVPKFDTAFRPTSHASQMDPDSSRAGLAKLKALVKQERKGAMRSLRGDNAFLAREKARVLQERDADYKSKIKRIMRGREGLEAEQADAKRESKGRNNAKMKAKRLAGRK